MPSSAPETAWSSFASSKTMIGDLPPSSSVTALSWLEASLITALPVPTEPVSDTLRIAGWRVSSAAGRGVALHDLEEPGRQARLAVGLLELDGRERREARGLEDHRVAEGERGRRLPAGDLQRIVPGADAGGDAERLAARVAEGRGPEVDVLAGRALRERREVLEALRAGDHVDDARFLDGLAGVAGLELGELVVARAQESRPRGAGCGRARPRAARAQAGCAARAAATAASTSAGPATGSSASRSPVAGFDRRRASSSVHARVLRDYGGLRAGTMKRSFDSRSDSQGRPGSPAGVALRCFASLPLRGAARRPSPNPAGPCASRTSAGPTSPRPRVSRATSCACSATSRRSPCCRCR